MISELEDIDEPIIPLLRAKEMNGMVFVTTDYGKWALLTKEEYKQLLAGRIPKESFLKLENNCIIITKKNIGRIISDYRHKNLFLFRGATLHIVIPTLRCNHKCVYCHASSRPANAKGFDMDKETAEKVVDFIFQTPSKSFTIEFQGGEPLLNFEIVKHIVERAEKLSKDKSKDVNFVLVSNLSLMDEQKLDYIINKNIGLCTSLDGPEHIHNRNRNSLDNCGSYNYVKEWVIRIRKEYKRRGINKDIGALVTITRHNLFSLKDVIDEYVKLGFRRIHLRHLNNLGFAKESWGIIGYSAEEFIREWKKAMDYIIELNKKGKIIEPRMLIIILTKLLTNTDPGFLDLRNPCGAAIGQLAYNYNGDIYTCDEGRMLGEDIFKIGNVKRDTYRKVLTSKQTCGIVTASLNDTKMCESCVWKPYCGLCPVCSYVEQGNIIPKLPQDRRCKILKAKFSYIVGRYLFDSEFRELIFRRVKEKHV